MSEQSKKAFARAVYGVLACYEAMGDEMPRQFGESGTCEGLGQGGSIWTVPDSSNTTLVIHARAEYDASDVGARGAKVWGSYAYENETEVCTGSVDLLWTEEDASIDFVKPPYCVRFSEMEYEAFGVAIAVARVRGVWADRDCMERGNATTADRAGDFLYPVSYSVPFYADEDAARQSDCSDRTDSVTVHFGTNSDSPTDILSATVDVTKAQVELDSADLDSHAFSIAMAFGRAQGSWVDRRCLESWDNGNEITYTVPFGELQHNDDDGEPSEGGVTEEWCPDPHYGVEIKFTKNADGTVWMSAATVIDA